VEVAVWGKMFRGCAGMRRLWYVGFSRPQNAPSRASASPTSYCPAPDGIYSGQIFNNELTHDSRKRIDTRNVARSVAYCKLSKLLDSTRELRKDQSTGRGRFRRRLNQVLQAVNNHAVVGDILIQGQGGTAALVWSSIRLLLRVTWSYARPLFLCLLNRALLGRLRRDRMR